MDVFDEVRNEGPTSSNTAGGDVFSEVRGVKAPAPMVPIGPTGPESTWWNALKGTGEAGLAIGSGTLRTIASAANDILPETGLGGPGARAALQGKIANAPALNYQGGPEAQPILNALQSITKPIGAIGSAIHQGISDVAGPRAADVAGDLAVLAPGLRGLRAPLESEGAIEAGHPLSEAAETEAQRVSDFKQRGQNLGLDLPEGGSEARHNEAAINNRPIINAAVRDELQLPRNSRLSPGMLEAARNQYTAPAYQAVRDIPEIPLPKDYLGDIDNFDSIAEKYRPPVSGTITGDQAVDMSRYLRNKANKYFSAAKGNPEYEDIGQAHWDAAQAVEDAVKSHLEETGQGKLASNWDDARVYAAKTYSVQSALDGAGNVKVPALKQQLLKGKPLSGDLETLANLGAEYPEAFKTTRVTMPQVGALRRGAATLAPAALAGAGGFIGGTPGAAIGAAAGEHVAGKILGQ